MIRRKLQRDKSARISAKKSHCEWTAHPLKVSLAEPEEMDSVPTPGNLHQAFMKQMRDGPYHAVNVRETFHATGNFSSTDEEEFKAFRLRVLATTGVAGCCGRLLRWMRCVAARSGFLRGPRHHGTSEWPVVWVGFAGVCGKIFRFGFGVMWPLGVLFAGLRRRHAASDRPICGQVKDAWAPL